MRYFSLSAHIHAHTHTLSLSLFLSLSLSLSFSLSLSLSLSLFLSLVDISGGVVWSSRVVCCSCALQLPCGVCCSCALQLLLFVSTNICVFSSLSICSVTHMSLYSWSLLMHLASESILDLLRHVSLRVVFISHVCGVRVYASPVSESILDLLRHVSLCVFFISRVCVTHFLVFVYLPCVA